jgi:predicted transcriptional regulator
VTKKSSFPWCKLQRYVILPKALCSSKKRKLSLKPLYYYQMKAGTKKYEYRRRFVRRPSITFLYLGTSPSDPLTSTIPAYVRFDTPIIDHPSKIGDIAESQKPGSSKSILEYMSGLTEGFAIPVLDVEDIEMVRLGELRHHFPHFVPPQSYIVLNRYPEMLSFLLQKASRSLKP